MTDAGFMGTLLNKVIGPMRIIAGPRNNNAQHQPGDDDGLSGRLAAAEAARGPMWTVGYYAPPTRDGRPVGKVIGDDAALLEKTSHVRRPREKMMEFFARTQIGLHDCLTLSRAELQRRCEIAEQREQDFRMSDFAPRPRPKTFLLDI